MQVISLTLKRNLTLSKSLTAISLLLPDWLIPLVTFQSNRLCDNSRLTWDECCLALHAAECLNNFTLLQSRPHCFIVQHSAEQIYDHCVNPQWSPRVGLKLLSIMLRVNATVFD